MEPALIGTSPHGAVQSHLAKPNIGTITVLLDAIEVLIAAPNIGTGTVLLDVIEVLFSAPNIINERARRHAVALCRIEPA